MGVPIGPINPDWPRLAVPETLQTTFQTSDDFPDTKGVESGGLNAASGPLTW
jgi:hypothetical protein